MCLFSRIFKWFFTNRVELSLCKRIQKYQGDFDLISTVRKMYGYGYVRKTKLLVRVREQVRVLFPIWVRNVVRVRVAFSKISAYTGTGLKPTEKLGTGEFRDIRYGYGIRTRLRTPGPGLSTCEYCHIQIKKKINAKSYSSTKSTMPISKFYQVKSENSHRKSFFAKIFLSMVSR